MIFFRKLLFISVCSVMIGACASLKTYFPDKEKDYHYSTEIPELDIPPDLSSDTIDRKSVFNEPSVATSSQTGTEGSAEKLKIDKIKLLQYDGGASRLKLDEPFDRAWRIVGKAISRQSLEIMDRNREEGIYYVQYDPDAHEIEDGSIWDELVFFFGDDQSQEKEYHVRLVENEAYTEIFVLDKKDKPLSQDTGLKLLNLLLDTIKEDLAED